MKPETVKTFLGVHTWTGLVAGLTLFIAFYTGSTTVFVHEIEAWESYTQEPLAHQDQKQAQELIDLFVAEHPEGSTAFRLYPSTKDHPGHSIYWFEQPEDKAFQSHKYLLSKRGIGRFSGQCLLSRFHLSSALYSWTAGQLRPVCLRSYLCYLRYCADHGVDHFLTQLVERSISDAVDTK